MLLLRDYQIILGVLGALQVRTAIWYFTTPFPPIFPLPPPYRRRSSSRFSPMALQNIYFSKSPSEFWRRWHITLSSWLRDYLYIPLGGNRHGKIRTYVNLLITMTLGGLWHGSAWNFVFWGIYHGILLVIYRFFNIRNNKYYSINFYISN